MQNMFADLASQKTASLSRQGNYYSFPEFLGMCQKMKFLDMVDYKSRSSTDGRLPPHPAKTYGRKWVAIGGLKGITLTYKHIYTFPQFLEVCRELNITSKDSYEHLKNSDPMLPEDPSDVYGKQWHRAGEWKCIEIKKRGGQKRKEHYDFEEFLVKCVERKFTSSFDYASRRHTDPKLPYQPELCYKDVWEKYGGWEKILNCKPKKLTERFKPYVKRIISPHFEEFIKICKDMKIVSRDDYHARRHLHAKLPSNPETTYKEWLRKAGGWGFITGRKFYSFAEFLNVCKQMNFASRVDYKLRYASDKKLTRFPSILYGDKWTEAGGWKCVSNLRQVI
jgi:hypothetical protein